MKRAKLIASSILVVLIVIIILQNTESVETQILFMTITMPHAVLLFVTALLGFAVGLLAPLARNRIKSRKSGS